MKYLLSLVYIAFTTLGIFLMKAGGDSLKLSFTNGITFKIGFITMLGFCSYLVSFLLWQKLIVTYDLSYIVPIITGISQVIILLGGIFFFKEQVNVYGIFGILFTIVGIILMAYGKK